MNAVWVGIALNAIVAYLLRRLIAWDRPLAWIASAMLVSIPYLVFGIYFFYKVVPPLFRLLGDDDED